MSPANDILRSGSSKQLPALQRTFSEEPPEALTWSVLVRSAVFGLALSTIALLAVYKPEFVTFSRIGCIMLFLCAFLVALVSVVVAVLVFTSLLLTKPKKPWVGAGDFLSNFSWDGKRPLKVTFITWGSRGDHQPMVALGVELASRGHKVTVMGLEKFRDTIECHPELNYLPYVDSNIWKTAPKLNEPGQESQFPFICAQFVADSFRELTSQYIKAAQDADVLVGQYIPLCSITQYTVAQVLKVPIFFVLHDAAGAHANTEYSFNPSTNRVRDHGWLTNIINTRALPLIIGVLNTLSPWSTVRTIRRELGLSTRWPFMEMLGPRDASSIPTFCTWDPTLWPPSKGFSSHWYSTGFFVTKGSQESHDPDGVLKWLEMRAKQGRKPIYAALGSFEHHDKTLFTRLLLEAAEELSLDVVTLKTSVCDMVEIPSNVFVANEVPQTQVFPECQLIVHHGGAGTASQAIRAGRPQVCVPAMHFQETWGSRIEEYGAGVMVTQTELEEAYTAAGKNKLLEAFKKVLIPDVATKAESLGDAALKTPGVKLAADKMLEYLNNVIAA